MTEIKFEITQKNIVITMCLIGACIMFFACGWITGNQNCIAKQELQSNPIVTPTPTPAPTPSNTVITFTVLSCTVSNGQYQVITTDGRSVIFPDYDSWNNLIPQGVYIADSTFANGNYYVKEANLLSYSNYHRPYVVGRDDYYYREYQQPKHQSYTPDGKPCLFAYCG
jgi:hypothetical protein